jgi:hypothetical protein
MHSKTQVKLDHIIKRLQEGWYLVDIANELGVSRQNISYTIRTYYPNWRLIKPIKDKQIHKPLSDLEVAQHVRFCRKRQNNKQTGQQWDITLEDISFPTHCPILGIELDYFAPSRQENSVSFDRIDNSKGYVKGNVIICSWRANRIKNDGTEDEHRRIADYLKEVNGRRPTPA